MAPSKPPSGRFSGMRTLSPKRRRTSSDDLEGPPPTLRRDSLRARRRARRASRNLELLHEPKPTEAEEQAFIADWGFSRAKEEELLAAFRKILDDENVLKPQFDKYMLRRFLRARQHDLKKAKDMFVAHVAWRKANGVDTILTDFEFPERDAYIAIYPQGYHQVDKTGRPIYIQHLGQINLTKIYQVTTEERILKFRIQEWERCLKYIMPACSKVAGRHIDQTFTILDLKGVGLRHFTGEVKRMIGKITAIDQNNYPETLGHTCIINAPSIFQIIWKFVRPMLDPRTQGKIEVCPRDYLPTLLQWVDRKDLPEYLGGTAKTTLVDDAGPWNDPQLVAEIDEDLRRRDSYLYATETSDDDWGSPAFSRSGRKSSAGLDPADSRDLDRASSTPMPQPLLQLPPISTPQAAAAAQEPGEKPPDASGELASTMGEKAVASNKAERAWSIPSSERGGPPILRIASTTSMRSTDDEAYYTPKSTMSTESSRFSFNLGTPGDPQNDKLSDWPGSDPRLESVEGRHPLSALPAVERDTLPGTKEGLELQDNPSFEPGIHPPGPIPILARVRALEDSIPRIEAGLTKQHPAAGLQLPREQLGQGTLAARVATLEYAVDVLLQAQMQQTEEAAASARQRTQRAEDYADQNQHRGCCAGCTIM